MAELDLTYFVTYCFLLTPKGGWHCSSNYCLSKPSWCYPSCTPGWLAFSLARGYISSCPRRRYRCCLGRHAWCCNHIAKVDQIACDCVHVNDITQYFVFLYANGERNATLLFHPGFSIFDPPDTVYGNRCGYVISFNLFTMILEAIFSLLPLLMIRSQTRWLTLHLVLKMTCHCI